MAIEMQLVCPLHYVSVVSLIANVMKSIVARFPRSIVDLSSLPLLLFTGTRTAPMKFVGTIIIQSARAAYE